MWTEDLLCMLVFSFFYIIQKIKNETLQIVNYLRETIQIIWNHLEILFLYMLQSVKIKILSKIHAANM